MTPISQKPEDHWGRKSQMGIPEQSYKTRLTVPDLLCYFRAFLHRNLDVQKFHRIVIGKS